MSAAWLIYVLGISVLLALAARAAESAALLYARATRWIWAAALSATLLFPLAAFVIRRFGPQPGFPDVVISGATRAVPVQELPDSVLMAHDWIAWSWLGIAIIAGITLCVAHTALRRARRHWTPASVCDADVLLSRRAGPAAVGIRRPVIVVPEWLLHSQANVQRMVVRHEAEHVRTHDPRFLAFGCLIVALVPWNPVVWWMLFRLRAAIELDCDRRVLADGTDAHAYGAMLLGIAARTTRLSFAAAIAQPPSLLERRIRTMTRRLPRFRLGRTIVAACVAGIAIIVACDTEPPVAPVEAPAGVTAEPDTRRVAEVLRERIDAFGRSYDALRAAYDEALAHGIDPATVQPERDTYDALEFEHQDVADIPCQTCHGAPPPPRPTGTVYDALLPEREITTTRSSGSPPPAPPVRPGQISATDLPDPQEIVLVAPTNASEDEREPAPGLYLVNGEVRAGRTMPTIVEGKIQSVQVFAPEEAIRRFGEAGRGGAVNLRTVPIGS